MRKSILKSMLLMMVTSLMCSSCTKEENQGASQEVSFTLDYTFVEGGSMTRAAGAEVYDYFYEKYIKTKNLTPTTYSLTFKEKENRNIVLTIDGTWTDPTGVRLPEGEYIVTGKSQPIEKETYYDYEYPSDTVYLTFDEEVKIVKDMSSLTLTANYDAFLLLFDVNNTKKISMRPDSRLLTSDENVFWLFMRDKMYRTSSGSSKGYYDLSITRKNEDKIDIVLENIVFEKGKYYYFNDMSNSFNLPPMESGN